MSFASETKKNLSRQISHNRCCQMAEFVALMKCDGTIRIGGNRTVSLVVASRNPAVAGKIFRLAKEIFDDPGQIASYRKTTLKKQKIYEVVIPVQERMESLFDAMGLTGGDRRWQGDFRDDFPWALVQKECCKRSYLRGAFLGCGSVNSPDGSYHLELACDRQSHALALQQMIGELGMGARHYRRKNQFVVYFKDGEQIAEFLSQIGAHSARLSFENQRITKEIYNNINRKNNFDMANVDKTIRSSMQQRQAIERIDATIGLKKLPDGLREVAELRLQYPEGTLAELAALFDPPLSKSGVSHRLKKLLKIAEDL